MKQATVHFLKTWPEYFKAIAEGRKTFELRQNDRDFHVDDYLLLSEYDPKRDYMGRSLLVRVTYIMQGMNKGNKPNQVQIRDALNEDYVIMSIEKMTEVCYDTDSKTEAS